MAKIGVVTFYGTIDNYGQVLQYLATQEYLKLRGHSATLLKTKGYRRTIRWRVKNKLVHYYRKLLSLFRQKRNGTVESVTIDLNEQKKLEIFHKWAEISERKEKDVPRRFEQFRERYYFCQEGTYDEILESEYDAYCVGSDQTWSAAGFDMMLGWVTSKFKRFSIAPSVGHRVYTDDEINGFKKYLEKFDFITVREDKGLVLSKKCGRNDAKKILDPTFLLTANQYRKYAESINFGKPFILVYLLGGEIQPQFSEIIQFCKSRGYDVKYIESQGRDENFESCPATVGQWLTYFDKASYILTNSFHGMAFSIIYQKPFLVFPLVGLMEEMNGRIYDLAKTMHLEDRIYSGNFDVLFDDIEWDSASDKIQENKTKLSDMLSDIGL